MKKFILYFLLALIFLGLGTLIFGFYNARHIRSFAKSADEINGRYNMAVRVKEIEKTYQKNTTRNTADLQNEESEFVSKLNDISKEAKAAAVEVEKLSTPRLAEPVRGQMLVYYQKSGEQLENLESLSRFIGQIFEVGVVFDKIKEDVSLNQMRDLIVEAKTKNTAVDTGKLPKDLQESAESLKASTDQFLFMMESVASGATEKSDELTGAYGEFSKKEDEYFANSRNFINSFEDLAPLRKNIDAELSNLRQIYFKI